MTSRYAVLLTLAFMATTVRAQIPQTAPPTPVSSDLTRSCTGTGVCTLTCMNPQGTAVIKENATRAVRIISLSNGNTEFRLDSGTEGVNVILVSTQNLACKLVGAV
ncbi:hypothetical protein [Herbaspirillum sp. YR522]|uniref:hypothetical protein n=1 Tax=Herbaspirillum sp. YR522 TaxID=1144342 RepID=UPI00026FAB5C|nr:hypothetical protein [Herbaspirillum sp. YR522]EJM97905.1 hypothetical protein PMI40_04180 [Herbaspirillum sp. YR522]